MSNDNELLIRISATAKEFVDEVEKAKKKTQELEDVLKTSAKVSAVAFAAFAASIAYVTKAFADYEKALVGVGKTTDINGKQLQDFGKKFQDMAARIPVATNELLGIAQAAGQLGVKGEKDLLKFTETVAKLGVATDLSGEEAAVALTRILTVTGEGVGAIDKFGSVIVQLGNNFAATESEIVRVATEVSRSTAVFGVNAAEAAALSAALKSLGVQAELGGSAVGRAYRAIDSAIRNGGVALKNLESITGMTGAALKKTFAEDSTAVFQKFIEGLGKISKDGGDTTAALGAFKLKGEEILKVLPVLAQNSELLGKALGMANKEMKNGTALNDEAAKAFATLSADGQRLQNVFTTLSSGVGEKLAPEISKLLKGLTSLIDSINKMDSNVVGLIATFIKWGAIITASLTAVISSGLAYVSLTNILAGLRVAFTVGRLAIVGFTAAATFGLSVILAFLPEIITGVASLFEAFNQKGEASGLDDITKKLADLKAQRDLIANSEAIDANTKDKNLEKLDAEIDKYRELQEAKYKASQGYGDGSMVMRPEADAGGFDPTFGLQAQSIPLSPEGESSGVTQAQADEDAKFEIFSKAQEKRLIAAKEANALLIAETSGMNETELALEKEFLEIAQAERLNSFEQNQELKAIEDENITLRYEVAAQKLAEHLEIQEQKNQEYRDLALGNENISLEARQALVTKYDAMGSKEKEKTLKNEKIFAGQRLQTEQQLTGAKFQLAQAAGEAVLALTGKNAIAGLALSKGIAVTQAFIDKARADTGALAQSRMLPPGASETYLAQALAVNASQFGISLGTIAAQTVTAVSGLNEGGMVPMSFGARRGMDSVPAMLTPNELVVPEKNFDEVVESTAASRGMTGGGSSGAGGMTLIVQGDFIGDEVYVDRLADKLLEGKKTRNLNY